MKRILTAFVSLCLAASLCLSAFAASKGSCLMDYRAVGGAAKETMRRCGHRGEDPGAMKKAMMKTVLHWNALLSPPPRHIAEMMIRGSTMGAIQMSKRINAYRYTAGEEALMLAERLLKVEEETVERMKAFL